MKRFLPFLLLALVAHTNLMAQKKAPIPVIFDSDMGPDYDDVGAIAMLHSFADSGEVRILATVASTRYEGVAAVFEIFNSYFGRPDLPIGVPGANACPWRDKQHWTDSLLANYPHRITANSQAGKALDVYRRVLASQPDQSVVVVTTGFFTNLAELLQSGPDQWSSLRGTELVKKKVKKLVSMAGRFPSGGEFNVRIDSAASQTVARLWPTPILLSGFEIGYKVHVGLPLVHNKAISRSPVQDVFRISIPLDPEDSLGRMSWDETAVLVAVKGYQPWYRLQTGTMVVNRDGTNTWINKGSRHAYLVEAQPPAVVEDLINRLIMHQPLKHGQ